MSTLVNWNPLNEAGGEQALEELRGTRWYTVAHDLAKQGAEPQEVYNRFVQMFPTRTAGAQLLKLAVMHLRNEKAANGRGAT